MTRQQSEALTKANRVRAKGLEVQKELRAHVITLGDALADERAAHLPTNRLMCAMYYWGPFKANRLLSQLQITPNRRAGDLTDRQRDLIVQAVGR